jgi:hypothetical protein
MTPELIYFLTGALCTLLIVCIECYHNLNKDYSGFVIPFIEGFVVNDVKLDDKDKMDTVYMV